jgi:cytochrome c553
VESFVPRWLRWLGYGLGAVVVLLVLALAGLYAVTAGPLGRRYELPDSPVRAATDSAALARGRHLVEAVGKCQECHGGDFGGKVMADDPMFGRLVASNLTSGEGGLENYSDADFERAIRHGVGQDGRALIFMPAEAFSVLSDADLAAVIGYMRTLPPVDRRVPGPRVGPIARALYLAGNFPLLPVELVDHDAARVMPEPGVSAQYGEYLASAGGCRSCHGADLAGTGEPSAPDITRSRLESWTERDFFRAIREGRRPDGSVIDPEKMPWVRSSQMTDDEIKATWTYIRSLPGKRDT